MLEIINNLKPFIEDNYIELGVRKYSRILKISPPTASKLLKNFEKQGLLKKRGERGYLLFRADRENFVLRDLSRMYWREKLKPVIEYLNSEFYYPTITLFGSLVNLKAKRKSDVDLAIFTKHKKKVYIKKFERKIGREIQVFTFKTLSGINNKELKANILNSYIVQGEIE